LSGSLGGLSFLTGSEENDSFARTPSGIADKAAVLNTTPFRKFRLDGDLFAFSMILVFIYGPFVRKYNKLMISKLKYGMAPRKSEKTYLRWNGYW
jgi:hypothetical protein